MQRSITTPIPRRTLIAAAVLIVLFAATLVLPGSHQSWAADEISETIYENSAPRGRRTHNSIKTIRPGVGR